jgi:hypothetical protein
LSRICPATKRDGSPCSGTVPAGKYHCWAHDPANRDARNRIASRAGRGNAKSHKTKLSKDLHALLEDLTQRVVDGSLEPYPASVAGQLIGVRLRLLEFERRVREQDELEERLAALEEAATQAKPGRRGGSPWGA